MSANPYEQQQKVIVAILEKYKKQLLSLPNVTGVAVGRKQRKGQTTEELSVVVFVREKLLDLAPHEAVPREMDGIQTDVVAREMVPKLCATDPFERFETMFSGISTTPRDNPLPWGTIGCIIRTDGTVPQVPMDEYILTCEHVYAYANPLSPHSTTRQVMQPGKWMPLTPAPANYNCGDYVYGIQNATNDCAVARIGGGRRFINQIPNSPGSIGYRRLNGIAVAVVGDSVYKYGATTKYTRGEVTYVNYDDVNLNMENAIVVNSAGLGDYWATDGDSGSVLVRYRDDMVLGMNFAVDKASQTNKVSPIELYYGYSVGFAYDIGTQLRNFGTNVTLA